MPGKSPKIGALPLRKLRHPVGPRPGNMAMLHRQLDPAAAVFAAKFRDIDGELVHLAAICRVNLLDDAKVERVIRNDESVCARTNHVAFEKLRELVLMHFVVRVRAVRAIGEEQTRTIIDEVVADIQHRLAVTRRRH